MRPLPSCCATLLAAGAHAGCCRGVPSLVSTAAHPAGHPTATVRQASRSQVAAAGANLPQLPSDARPVVVWLKRDLRVADHPGLTAAAAAGRPVAPLFVADPRLLAPLLLVPGGVPALAWALQRLQAQLQGLGSSLVVRVGDAATEVAAVAAACGAGCVVAEREVEHSWLEAERQLRSHLAATPAAGSSAGLQRPTWVAWTAPLWDGDALAPNYRQWRRQRGAPLPPLPAPAALPPLPAGVRDAGAVPSAAELAAVLAAGLAAPPGWAPEPLQALAQALPAAAASSPVAAALCELLDPQATAGQLLGGYLASADGGAAARGPLAQLPRLVEALETPSNPGGSFHALLDPLVGVGALSRRQVWAAATAYERGRWGGRLPLGGPATATVKAALAAAELGDFHTQLAAHQPGTGEGEEGGEGRVVAPTSPIPSYSSVEEEDLSGEEPWGPGQPRRLTWRWRGALTDYCMAQPPQPLPGAPALLLVHGFGAFGDQWRGQMAALAQQGFRVYAPTFPGFGRSQKAPLDYSQDTWRDFLRDFVVGVVKAPVVAAGNSIGGFISASLAADHPDLVSGLALLNSAGPIDAGYDAAAAAAAPPRAPPPRWVAAGAAAALMAVLERRVPQTLTWLYPTNPGAADAWLAEEICRAAADPRAGDVFASVFYLPPPRALNHLVGSLYRRPTLVLQGALDPLNDARGRAAELARLCPNVRVALLQAGHCPHDEVPGEVNAALAEFVVRDVMGGGGSGSGLAAAAEAGAAAAVGAAAAAAAQ